MYQPEQGISMVSPISRLIAEIFLQHYEDIHIKQLLDTNNVALYTRYVDDILIIHDITKIHPHAINTYINQIHNNIRLNPTHENHSSINFLDLTVTSKQTNLEINIYRKPTTTDTTINFISNYPIEHKMAAFKFHISRISTRSEEETKRMGNNTNNSQNSNFPQKPTPEINRQIQ
jgi:hypothetical protein